MNPFGLLTLLSHSLRQESRSRSAHWFRQGSMLIALWLLGTAHYYSPLIGNVGRPFVESLTYLDLILILVAGSSYFGSVITEEKEQGTLGLLKLAGFSNAGLMIGKSTARILSALVVFMMQVPFAFLAVVLGGISAPKIVATYLALGAYLVLLGNIGLLMSTICRRNALATSSTFLIGAILIWGGKIAAFSRGAGIARQVPGIGRAVDRFIEFESWFSIHNRLNDLITNRTAPLVTGQLGWSLGLAVGLFTMAWLLFDRFTEYTETVDPHRSGSILARWQMGVSRPWWDPLAWKEYQFSTGGHTTFGLKLVLYGVLIALGVLCKDWAERNYSLKLPELVFSSLVIVFLLECLIFSGSFLGSEFVGGTLPNLMLLPHSMARITASKFLGGLLATLPTLVGVAVASRFIENGSILYDWTTRDLVLVTSFILLLHLTTFYSIVFRRGAVAWAFGTLMIGSVILLPLLEAVRLSLLPLGANTPWQRQAEAGSEFWAPLLYFTTLMCLGIQVAIGVRIHKAVGE